MDPLMWFFVIMAFVLSVALFTFVWMWRDRGRWIKIYKEQIDIDAKQSSEYYLRMVEAEEKLVEEEKEILALRIEVDASTEQLTQEQSSSRLREDQIQRIREIIQGEPIDTENSDSEQQERNTYAARINHS